MSCGKAPTSGTDLSNGSDGSSSSPPHKKPKIEEEFPAEFQISAAEYMDFLDLFCDEESDDDPPVHDTEYAKLALLYYNQTQGKEYQFIIMRLMYPIYRKKVAHLNFFAELDGSPQAYLFYADIDMSKNATDVVVSCSILRTFPDFPRYAISEDHIIHPEDVVCVECNAYNTIRFDCCCDSD